MHVISRLNVGGTSVWLENLTHGLQDASYSSRTITGRVKLESEHSFHKDPSVEALQFWGKNSSLISNLRAFLHIRRRIKELKPLVVNTHTSLGGLIGRMAVISLPRHKPLLIHTMHGHYLYGYGNKLLSKMWLLNEVFLALFTDKIICVGSSVARDIQQTKMFKLKKLAVILPGIEMKDSVSRNKARKQFRINKDAFVIGWMGRFEYVKDPKSVIELALKNLEINFLLAGSGTLKSQLQKLNLGNVKFLPEQKPGDFWPACDIALSTSLNEGVPTALVEASICGIPILARNVGSIRDVVRDQINGFLVDSLAVDDIDKILKSMCQDSDRLQKMSLESRKLGQEFSIQKMIFAHLQVYELGGRN